MERIRGEKTALLPAKVSQSFSLSLSLSLCCCLFLTVDMFQLMYCWPILLQWSINKTVIHTLNEDAKAHQKFWNRAKLAFYIFTVNILHCLVKCQLLNPVFLTKFQFWSAKQRSCLGGQASCLSCMHMNMLRSHVRHVTPRSFQVTSGPFQIAAYLNCNIFHLYLWHISASDILHPNKGLSYPPVGFREICCSSLSNFICSL